MQYEFSLGAFFLGILILAAGIVFARYYQVIADNLGSGVMSYDRFRLAALITCGVGILVTLNLHTYILMSLLRIIFPGLS